MRPPNAPRPPRSDSPPAPPPPARDLAGEFTDRVTYDPMRDSCYVQRTQDLGAVKYAAYVQVPAELAADIREAKALWDDLWRESFDRVFRPWLFPDRNPMPRLDWWPWLSLRRR